MDVLGGAEGNGLAMVVVGDGDGDASMLLEDIMLSHSISSWRRSLVS